MPSGEFIAMPGNAKLFTFMGRTALENGDYSDNTLRNHIYLLRKGGEGTYLFGRRVIGEIGSRMLKLNFPASLNDWEVPESDEAAYQDYLKQNDKIEGDSFPEEWLK